MGRASENPITYTHVGCRAAVGYQHCGRDFNHYAGRGGRMHALNAEGCRRYRAVCGATVAEDSDDEHDQGGRNPVVPASEGVVTCKRCLARRPALAPPSSRVEYRLMYEDAAGLVECWAARRRRAEVEQWGTFLTRERGAIRTWVEEVEIITTY
jgi:hypothetical protein